MPYRDVQRGRHCRLSPSRSPSLLVKRVVGLPGDRLRIEDGRVMVNGVAARRALCRLRARAAQSSSATTSRPRSTPIPKSIPTGGGRCRASRRNGELVVPPGEYFVLGDNRNHSKDSRFWGFVPRQAIVARPLVIYFSLRRPSTTDVQAGRG